MLQIIKVTKSYDGVKKACNEVDLSIEAGDLYGFIGHNGAGKTTLLKSIAGIISFDEGDILVDGFSIISNPLDVKNRIAYIPDQPNVYESLTGMQYLDFIADVFKVEKELRRQRIHEYVQLFELEEALNQPIASYSHGMKQKIVIISALIHQPKLFLLDEPFVGLDPKASYNLKQVFQKMREKGTAIFFSTHVLEVAEKLCNKVAIIKQGKIVAHGETKDVIKDSSLESIFMEIANEA
ncbi:ABC transporter ATP-binding protein [Liberiplasma polymorphum]|uniref:ABC transporter ATP-binding protein n=1 Tax=Liberiplasma polymorphum TaxID=3374570 RepID=UPI00377607CA